MRKIIKYLLCFSFIFVMLALCGCSSDGVDVSFIDFEDKEIEVEIGEKYIPDYQKVLDEDGKEYLLNDSLYITAQNIDGEEVAITNGSFTVKDFNGYTVYYRIYIEDEVFERKVEVKVKDTTKPTVSIYNFRTEYELGYIPVPSFYINDNSGENINISYYEFYDSTGETLLDQNYFQEIEYNGKRVIEAKVVGEYILRAKAQDLNGNSESIDKKVIISDKKADNVWEDFSSKNSLEGIKTSSLLTSQNEVKYLDTFESAEGVVEIQSPFREYWGYEQNIQISLPKIVDDIYDCHWSSFTIRAYFIASDEEQTVTVKSNGENIGTYPTKQWVDIEIKSSQFLLDTGGGLGLSENTALDIKYYNFATSITSDTPAPILTIYTSGKETDSIIKTYIDNISWTEAEEDTEAPQIIFTKIKTIGAVGSSIKIPAIKVLDNLDAINQYSINATSPSGSSFVVSGGTFKLAELGKYKLAVSATDFAGNTTTETITITSVESIDENDMPIATYDADDTLTKTNASSTEWLDTYDGKTGVMKCTFAAGTDTIQMGFSSQDWMLSSYRYYYDYIKLNVRFEFIKDQASVSGCGVGLTSGNAAWITDSFNADEWKELTLYTKDFANRGYTMFISSPRTTPYNCSQRLYEMLNDDTLEEFLEAPKDFFKIVYPYFGTKYNIANENIQVIMYVDSVSIGFDTEAPTIDDTSFTKTGTVGAEYSLNGIIISDNSDTLAVKNSSQEIPYCIKNFDLTDDKGGCEYKVYKYDGGVKGAEQTVTFSVVKNTRNVYFTPTEAGNYVIEVKAKDFAGNETSKSIEITIN